MFGYTVKNGAFHKTRKRNKPRHSIRRFLLTGAAIFGIGVAIGASAQEPTPDYLQRSFHGHTYHWPLIGTAAYSGSCQITKWWEDGSAIAYCTEDGSWYAYDPDGNYYYDHGILFRISYPGWHTRHIGALALG